jgi:hypothetical protein
MILTHVKAVVQPTTSSVVNQDSITAVPKEIVVAVRPVVHQTTIA